MLKKNVVPHYTPRSSARVRLTFAVVCVLGVTWYHGVS